jgi:hypothetical protein
MSRHPATLKWVGSISIAVVLAFVAACSKQNSEPAPEAGSAQAVEAAPTPAAANPEAPAAVAEAPAPNSAPAPSSAPMPAETVVTPEPVPVAETNDQKARPPEAAADSLKWLQESEARKADYESSLAELSGKVETAKSDLATAQKDLLAFRNPYMARPVLTPEEATKTQSLNGAERVQWAESRVATAIAALESAQKAYDDAKANPPN